MNITYWRLAPRQWVLLGLLLALTMLTFRESLGFLYKLWMVREEYSHGIMIPFISAFLVWQSKNELAERTFSGAWSGVVVTIVGVLIYIVGELSSLYNIIQYAFIIVLLGIVLAIMGKGIFEKVWIPIAFLFFAIPLPTFLYRGLSSELQLISSKLGVYVIRLFGISVYLEGNVIDLGSMQLQVVEACNGLRYLFPLMSLAFICAYFFKVSFWKRAVVFFSSIPITVFMNSFRIGVIGVTVEYWGKEMAEGFLHDFEGWIIFMACTGILMLEMWVLAMIGKEARPLMEVFGLTTPAPLPDDAKYRERTFPKQYWIVLALLLGSFGLSIPLGERQDVIPNRTAFVHFPENLGEWRGRPGTLEQQYIDTLKFEDYILSDYIVPGTSAPVNFYVAYYESQRKGESIHSPRSCIPGGGWEIQSIEQRQFDEIILNGAALRVNRLTIQKGEDRQLVYYWFQQRGRDLTNEYLIKWYLFWDSMTINRTDGALVRLTTYAPKGEDLDSADRRLKEFLKKVIPELPKYVPD